MKPSRHRGVLSLRKKLDVFDMREQPLSWASIVGAKRAIRANKISTRRPNCAVCGHASFIPIELHFHNEKAGRCWVCIVHIPRSWSTGMFLAAVNWNLNRNRVVSIESFESEGQVWSTVNDVSWLYRLPEDKVFEMLCTSGSFVRVSGGVFKLK